MSYNLFLDDFRNPQDCVTYMRPRMGNQSSIYGNLKWVVIRSHDDFCSAIALMGMPSIVSFDHDLDDEHYTAYHAGIDWGEYYANPNNPKTGWHCAKWLLNWCKTYGQDLPRCFVHSMNETGTRNIQAVLGIQ